MKCFMRLALLLSGVTIAVAFDYSISSAASLFLTDENTGIDELVTLHKGDSVLVQVQGVEWVEASVDAGNGTVLSWSTSLNGVVVASGSYDLEESGKELPSSLDVGSVTAGGKGSNTITVTLQLNDVTVVEESYQTFGAGAAIVPLIVILVLAVSTRMVEISLLFGIFVGACMSTGSMRLGFFRLLDTYVLGALADEDHGFVYLFSFFLSGLVGMMEKSGGFAGFTKTMNRFATTARAGQMTSFIAGCCIFFDDYANTLIVGESMRPISDLLSISREKLAFVVDGTSAPIASIVPFSAWIGFEVGLINEELEKLVARDGEISISDNGLTVFLKSVKYRYYPFFMLFLMPTLIWFKRDYGPMLIAERKTQVYARQDGGDGKRTAKLLGEQENKPAPDTPKSVYNMVIPLAVLIILIIYLLIDSGDDGSGDQSLVAKLENSNSYSALLYSTMAAALLTLLFYHVQFKQDGDRILLPLPSILKQYFQGMFKKNDDEAPTVRPLMNLKESMESFLYGMGRIFPAAIVLTLAWASGTIMSAVGTDRLFAAWITGGLAVESLPTISFIISFLMALATGTSWGTMTIMFPLLVVPTYDSSGGDPVIVYATIAGILSGAVAGDHVSPISDTTVLSSLATDCQLVQHVATQAPYVLWITIFSILVGTIPIGYGGYPNIISYLLGYILILAFIFGICKPVISKTGSFDIFTELYLKLKPDSPIADLKSATAQAYENELEEKGTAAEDKAHYAAGKETNNEEPLAVAEEGSDNSNLAKNVEDAAEEDK